MKKILAFTPLIISVIFFYSCMRNIKDINAGDVYLYYNSPAWELAKAVDNQDTEKIKRICKEHKDLINTQDPKFGMNLLEFAVFDYRYKSAKALAESGADPNMQDSDGVSAFIQSASMDTSIYLELLLAHGGDVNARSNKKNGSNSSPLIAASSSNFKSVKLLVEAGANINFATEGSPVYTPVGEAAIMKKLEILKYLIIDKGGNFKMSLGFTSEGDSIHVVDYFRYMVFPLDSKDYKLKMELVDFMKKHGVDYRKTPIPDDLYGQYSKEYLDKY